MSHPDPTYDPADYAGREDEPYRADLEEPDADAAYDAWVDETAVQSDEQVMRTQC